MPGMPVTWQQLLSYYRAVVGEEPVPGSPSSERGTVSDWFRWSAQEEGNRFCLYSGTDLLLSFAGPASSPGDSEAGLGGDANGQGDEKRWRRLGVWSGDRFYYGYPLVLEPSAMPSGEDSTGDPPHLYPLLFFPIAATSYGWVVRTFRPRLNPLLWPAEEADQIRVLRLLGQLQRILAAGCEPSPVLAIRAGRLITSLCRHLDIPTAETVTLLDWGRELGRRLGTAGGGGPTVPVEASAVAAVATGQVFNRAVLFRLPSYLRLAPDWLSLAWKQVAQHQGQPFPENLQQWVAFQQSAIAAEEEKMPSPSRQARSVPNVGGIPPAVHPQVGADAASASGPELQRASPSAPGDGDALLALDILTPAERGALTRVLAEPAGLLQVPAGEGEARAAFHLVLNLWYRHARVLVIAPGDEELRLLAEQLEELTALPFLGVWGSSERTAHTWERLWRWLRRGMGGSWLTPAAPVGLAEAWQQVAQVEQGVQRASQAGQRYLQARAQMSRPAAEVQLPPALARTLHQAATGKPEAVERLRLLPEPDRLSGCLAEAERIQRGQWHWSERLWPWRRQQRALTRLQGQATQVLTQAGLTPTDWLDARRLSTAGADPSVSLVEEDRSPAGWVDRLRRWQATWEYGRRAGQLTVWQGQAGAGDWESPNTLVGKLRTAFEQVQEATREAIVGRRRQELAGLAEQERLALIDFLTSQAALGQEVVPPSAEPAQSMWHSLRQLESEQFGVVQQALPIWGLCVQECERPLPDRDDLFDRIVVIGAERIGLGVALPYLAKGRNVTLIAAAGSPGGLEGTADGDGGDRVERSTGLGPGSNGVEQDDPSEEPGRDGDRWLAARFGLMGEEYLHYRWTTSVYEWAARGSQPANWLRLDEAVLPLAQLRQSLLLGGNGMVAGPPAGPLPAVRWLPVDGHEVCPRQGSAYNLEEAGALLSLMDEALQLGSQSATGSTAGRATTARESPSACRVALVTPFWRQKEVLLRLLLERKAGGSETSPVRVLLPREMVGLAADWVILSPVVQMPAASPAARYLREHPGIVEQVLRSARRGLWIAGSGAAAQTLGGLWAELVQAVESVNALAEVAPAGERLAGEGSNPADEAAAAGDRAFWCEQGPYPTGSEGVAALYRELLLAKAGWKGRRELVEADASRHPAASGNN